MGNLNLFGKDDSGSVSDVVLIPSTSLAQAGEAFIKDFGATAGPGAVDTLVRLEISATGAFGGEETIVAELEMPSSGSAFASFSSPIRFSSTQFVRVVASQAIAGRESAFLSGETASKDLQDF